MAMGRRPFPSFASLVSCFTCHSVRETCATPPTIEDVFSEGALATAHAWLIERRKTYPPSSDIWSFRRGWKEEKACLRQQLVGGRYRFDVLDRVRRSDGDEMDLWSSRDALVVKCLALVLARCLPLTTTKNPGAP